uniref:Non-structural maintenance of chromosomes element 4 n=1 Tax=Plectus sambesii TaxID=2011161 RepID=A0A914V7M3_9BILA
MGSSSQRKNAEQKRLSSAAGVFGEDTNDDETEMTAEERAAAEQIAEGDDEAGLQENGQSSRRKLREKYRQIIDAAEDELRRGATGITADELCQRIEDTDQLFRQVSFAREGACDAQLMVRYSRIGLIKLAERQEGGKAFHPALFAAKLGVFCGVNAEPGDAPRMTNDAWVNFGRKVGPLLGIPPKFSFLSGCLKADAPKAKEKIARREANRTKLNATVLQAKEQHGEAEDPELTTTKEVDHVRKTLLRYMKAQRSHRFGYFEFVLHPTDFGKTVENMFHVSFLVKDGQVGIDLDEKGLPMIVKLSDADKKRLSVGDRSMAKTNQCIVSITMEQWERLVDAFGISEPAISRMPESDGAER